MAFVRKSKGSTPLSGSKSMALETSPGFADATDTPSQSHGHFLRGRVVRASAIGNQSGIEHQPATPPESLPNTTKGRKNAKKNHPPLTLRPGGIGDPTQLVHPPQAHDDDPGEPNNPDEPNNPVKDPDRPNNPVRGKYLRLRTLIGICIVPLVLAAIGIYCHSSSGKQSPNITYEVPVADPKDNELIVCKEWGPGPDKMCELWAIE